MTLALLPPLPSFSKRRIPTNLVLPSFSIGRVDFRCTSRVYDRVWCDAGALTWIVAVFDKSAMLSSCRHVHTSHQGVAGHPPAPSRGGRVVRAPIYSRLNYHHWTLRTPRHALYISHCCLFCILWSWSAHAFSLAITSSSCSSSRSHPSYRCPSSPWDHLAVPMAIVLPKPHHQ